MKILQNSILLTDSLICLSFIEFNHRYPLLNYKEVNDKIYGPLTYLFTGDILHACYLQHPQPNFKAVRITPYLNNLPQFKEIMTIGTPFQQSVWKLLLKIPQGQTKTYGQIAQEWGNTKAARAIGQAVGANPVGIHIPCHRVIGSNGQLGGFYWGVDIKKEWLEKEKT